MRVVLTWISRTLLVLTSVMVALVLSILFGLSTDAGNEWIRKQALNAAGPSFPHGSLEIGGLDTNILGYVRLSDVVIRDDQGKSLITVDGLYLDYGLSALVRKEVHLEAIRIEKPSLDLSVDPDGTMDILAVFGPSEEVEEDDESTKPFAGLPVDIRLDEFAVIDGAVLIKDPNGDIEVPNLNVGLGVTVRGSTVDITGIHLDVDADSPLDEDIRLAGALALVAGDVRVAELLVGFGEIELGINGTIASAETAPVMGLNLTVDPLSPATIEALAGEPVLRVPLVVNAEVKGPLSDLNVGMSIPSPDGEGELRLKAKADLEATPMAWGVELHPSNFQVHAITDLVPPPFVLDGKYAVTGTGTEYPSGIDADIQIECGPQIFAGEGVQSLRLNGKLNAGRLGLNIQELVHEVAQVSLVSNVDLVESRARARASVYVPNAARLAKYGVQDMGGSVRYDGDIVAAWEPELDVDLEGELQINTFSAPGLYIASGGGPVHALLKGETAEATGDVILEGLDASGTTVDSVQLVFSGGQAADGSVDVNAELNIGVIAMPDGQFDMQGLEGSMVASVPATGDLAASADLVVKTFRFGDGDYSVDGGPVSFTMSGDKITADIDLQRKDTPFLAGSIMGDLATGQWNIDGFRLAVLEGDGLDAEQSMQFQLADGGAKDILIEISNADGKGTLKIEGEATAAAPDLRVTADNIDLSYIIDMVGEVFELGSEEDVNETSSADPLADLSGLASMALEIKGEDELINADGWVAVDDLVMPGQLNEVDTRIDVSITDAAAVATIRVADDDKTLFWSKTNVPILQKAGNVTLDCDQPLRARSMIPGVDFKKLAKQIPAIGNDLRGRASVDLKVDGEACNPNIGLVAAMDTAIGAQGERIRLDVEFERKDDELVLKTTVEQENQRIAEIGALLATRLTDALGLLIRDGKEVDMADPQNWLDNFDVYLKLQSADLSRLARMGEVNHPIEGKLGGGFRLSGSLDNPDLRGNLALVDGRVGEAKMRAFTVDLAPVEGGYALDTNLDFFDAGGMQINGFLPLDLRLGGDVDLARPGLDIRISGDGIPLAMAAGPTGLAEARGTIQLTGEVSGTLEKPEPKLAIGSNQAGFTLLATALRYEPIDLDIEYRPDRLLIRDISVRSGQLWGQAPKSGTISIAGDVGLDEEGPTDISISTKMKEFWLSATRQANIAASGNISIDGGYPDLKIAGAIAMDEATISVGEEVLKDTSGFEVDETIQIHRETREVVAVRREDEPEESAADNFVVDLKVDLAQKVRLRADVPLSEDFGSQFSQLATFNLDIGLDGVLDIAQEHGALSVVGELATMRGEMVALGKRFTLTEGDITFTGENYTNPQLSILAAHQVGQYGSVDIAISGDVENTAMELSSVEYPDQTDVMSMLLFGKPTSAMSETEGESGSGLLSAAMASVGGQAARATGAAFLQNVQIDPGSGSVKVGFPLTDKIYLSIEKVTPEEDTDNVTQAALEWILSRQTYGELITGDRGQSSGDLYWRWRF